MYVVSYENEPHNLRLDGVEMTDFFAFTKGVAGGKGVQMGFGVFPPGVKAPPAIHNADEYAFVIKGGIKAEVSGKVFEAKAGTATFIPAGEEHISFNDSSEECRLVWILVDK